MDRRHMSVRPEGGLSLQAQEQGGEHGSPVGQRPTADVGNRRLTNAAPLANKTQAKPATERSDRGGAVLQVSKHGAKRARQRVGLPKRAVERNAQRALTEGIGYREATGALRRYLGWLYERYDGNGNNIRIYGDKVWVFHDGILITVLNMPREHWKAAKWQMKKRRNEHG